MSIFPTFDEVDILELPVFFFPQNVRNKQYSLLLVQYAVTSAVLNAYKMACEFLLSPKLLQLLHQQPPYQLVLILIVIFNATLKLAELAPCLFLHSSKNSLALDIYLGKRRTIEPLLTKLFIVNFSNGFSGTKPQSSRSFRKCTYLFSAYFISFTHKVQQIRDIYSFSFKRRPFNTCYEQVLSHV